MHNLAAKLQTADKSSRVRFVIPRPGIPRLLPKGLHFAIVDELYQKIEAEKGDTVHVRC